MKIINISVKRPITTLMVTLAIVVFGLISLNRLPINLMPDISYPTVTIKTEWEGVAPQDIEEQVTVPIEEQVAVMDNLQNIVSYSRPGMSIIAMEFGWDTDMNDVVLDLRESLSRLSLPDDSENPQILRYNPNLEPIMKTAFFSKELDNSEIRTVLDDQIKDKLLTLNGVATVTIKGGQKRNLFVKLDTLKLSSLGISSETVFNKLEQENESFAAGTIEGEENEYLIRLLNKFRSLDEIRNLIISKKENNEIRLKEVAEIYIEGEKEEDITKVNGERTVVMEIYKKSGENTVSVAKNTKERLKYLVEGLNYSIISDKSLYIDSSIKSVFSSAIYGGVLAIFILLLFLKDFKATSIIAVAIPLSIIAVFLAMYLKGISLNIMSIGGLALGVGMLVDNSIVVLESIDRVKKSKKYKDSDDPLQKSSIYGTKIVGNAITASTLTTIAVFFPIVFVEGMAGKIFSDQAFTVAFALIASLIVAISIIPMLSSLSLKRKRLFGEDTIETGEVPEKLVYKPESFFKKIISFISRIYKKVFCGLLKITRLITRISTGKNFFKKIAGQFDKQFEKITIKYEKNLKWSLNNRKKVITTAIILLVISFSVLYFLNMDLMPDVEREEFNITVVPKKNLGLQDFESILDNFAEEFKKRGLTETIYSKIGKKESEMDINEENTADLFVRLNNNIKVRRGVILIREYLDKIPGIEYEFNFPQVFEVNLNPVQIEIYGEDLNKLKEVEDRIVENIKDIEGLKDLKKSLKEGNPEVNIIFSRDKLSSYGLDVGDINRLLELEIKGDTTNKYDFEGDSIDIKVVGRGTDLKDYRRLVDFKISTPEGQIPLNSLGKISLDTGPSSITRKDQEKVALITGNYDGISLKSVTQKIDKRLNQMVFPEGISVEIGGESEKMNQSSKSMQFAVLLAIFLVYIVMASQFESLVHPFVIIFSIPFALIGVVIALLISGNSINIISLIGFVMLAGIVVNNGIVLVDYVNHLRRNEGYSKIDAIIEGGKTRLRPILMTTSTTVLGLIPMAVMGGNGSELRSPLAWTVIGGILSSTILTLILIPVVYSIVESKGSKK